METRVEYKIVEQAAPTDEQLCDWYNLVYQEMKPLKEELDRLRAAIVERVVERGETMQHGNVTATYRQGSTRVTWNSKALDGFAVAHPEILEFRKEAEVRASAAIRVLA